jgi:alanyl-tRNA synthetase
MPADTQREFDSDPCRREFDAVILEIDALPQGQGVVLSGTCFYPEGGGQPSDRGTLNGLPVHSVTETDGRILHIVEGSAFKPGGTVRGVVDWERRFDHMQQHSGQHLLSQAFVRVLGADTVSFHLGSEESSIDVGTAYLSGQAVLDVEKEANRIVFENRELRSSVRPAGDLDSIPLRKRPDLSGEVRLVEIAEYDWSLCCGTHVRRTGEIGIIKILGWEKYKGGTRVRFACGSRALRDYQSKTGLVQSLSRLLTAGENEIPGILSKWKDERKITEKRIEALLEESLSAEASRMTAASVSAGRERLVSALFRDREPGEVQSLCRKVIATPGTVAVIGTVRDRVTIYFGRSDDVKTDMRTIQKAAAEVLNGKGGGSPNWAQCSSERADLAEAAMTKAAELLKS